MSTFLLLPQGVSNYRRGVGLRAISDPVPTACVHGVIVSICISFMSLIAPIIRVVVRGQSVVYYSAFISALGPRVLLRVFLFHVFFLGPAS